MFRHTKAEKQAGGHSCLVNTVMSSPYPGVLLYIYIYIYSSAHLTEIVFFLLVILTNWELIEWVICNNELRNHVKMQICNICTVQCNPCVGLNFFIA